MQSKRDLFVAATGDTYRCDQHNLMDRPFASLTEARHPASMHPARLAADLAHIPVQPLSHWASADVLTLACLSRQQLADNSAATCEITALAADVTRIVS